MNKLIENKRTYVASDGEEYVFMGVPSYNTEKLRPRTLVRMNQDHNARIDKFTNDCLLMDRNDIDLVMYMNHIFNPFAVQEGDIIYAPSSDDYYFESEEPTLVDGSHHSENDSVTKKKTYAETVEYLGKIGLGVK